MILQVPIDSGQITETILPKLIILGTQSNNPFHLGKWLANYWDPECLRAFWCPDSPKLFIPHRGDIPLNIAKPWPLHPWKWTAKASPTKSPNWTIHRPMTLGSKHEVFPGCTVDSMWISHSLIHWFSNWCVKHTNIKNYWQLCVTRK